MAEMIFPAAPVDGEEITQPNGKTYIYNTAKARWEFVPAAIAGSGMVALESRTLLNVPEADIVFPGGYEGYHIEIGYVRPATDTTNLYMRTSSDGGATFDAGGTDYGWNTIRAVITGAVGASGFDGADHIQLSGATMGNAANEGGAGSAIIRRAADAQFTFMEISLGSRTQNGSTTTAKGHGYRREAAQVNAVRFYYSAGDLAEFSYTLYGLKAA